MTDTEFLETVTDRLAALPGVRAVTLGGSRAEGTHTADSDWDLAVYYRGAFDPNHLHAIGWEGEVFDIGGWGGGVFNGGAWLTIEGRRVDVHYRDLDVVQHELQAAEVAGVLATAAMQTGHAVLAARGEWVLNEKRLLHRAGLRRLDAIIAGLRPQPETLTRAVADAEALFASAR